MRKYYISDIDIEVNKGKCISLEYALKKVLQHIVSNIDPTFPADKFMEWCNSETERPYRWNSTLYYWSRNLHK